MTTHNVQFALECCQQVAVLARARLILDAGVSDIDAAEFTRDYLSYARADN